MKTMNRREFIVKSTGLLGLLGLPLIIQQIGCDGGYDSSSSEDGTDSESFTVSSSVDSGHSHTVKILYADVNNPPGSNKTLTSGSAGSHTHQITLTSSDYQSLKDGDTVVKTSTTNSNHSHTFSIKVP